MKCLNVPFAGIHTTSSEKPLTTPVENWDHHTHDDWRFNGTPEATSDFVRGCHYSPRKIHISSRQAWDSYLPHDHCLPCWKFLNVFDHNIKAVRLPGRHGIPKMSIFFTKRKQAKKLRTSDIYNRFLCQGTRLLHQNHTSQWEFHCLWLSRSSDLFDFLWSVSESSHWIPPKWDGGSIFHCALPEEAQISIFI